MANIGFTRALANSLVDQGIRVNHCAWKVLDTPHPGKFLGRRSDTGR